MALVVVVQRDEETARRYAGWLADEGHAATFCPGPTAPDYRCAFLRDGRCPLLERADLGVYDPWLDRDRYEANSADLVLALRGRYPDRPLVLIGPSLVTPTWVERLARRDPLVRAVFPASRTGLLAAVAALVGPAGQPRSADGGPDARPAAVGPAASRLRPRIQFGDLGG